MNKKFIFKYEPQALVKEMFTHFEEAIKTGKKYIQPKNVSITSDLTVINRILSKTRLELFSVLREKQPNNIHELAQLLHRDYSNVWRDCQVLVNCGIIELKKIKKETQPIALYDQIIIDFGISKEKNIKSIISPRCLEFIDESSVFKYSLDNTISYVK